VRQCGLLKPTQQLFGASQKLLNGRTNDLELALKPTCAGGNAMMLQPQKRANGPADMIALRNCFAASTSLHTTKLLQPTMICLDRPDLPRQRLALVHRQSQVTRGPVFRVTVWSVDPKYQDKAIALEMHARARLANGTLREWSIARAIRVDLTIGFQAREEVPAVRADGLEIGQRAVPAIEGHIARLKTAVFGGYEHGLEVIVLGRTIERLVKQSVIARDGVLAITPQHCQQIDARDDPMVLARPMPMHQFDFVGIRLVQRGVVEDEQAAGAVNRLLGFAPEWRAIRFKALKEARERVMGSTAWPFWLDACGFGTRDHLGCGEKKVDVVQISHFGCIHRCMIAHDAPTA
jgi:hypothetical protein